MEGVSSTGLKEVVVYASGKHVAAQVAKTTVGSITANFAKGVVESGINTLVGALNIVIHPIETAKQVGSLIDKSSTFEGRLMLGLNLGISVANTYNDFKSGNADVKANIAGNLVGDIAQLFIGTGEVKAASYAMRASNFERQMLKFAQNAEKAKLGAAKGGVNAVEQVAVHGNSLKSLKPTWGYKLYSQDGTFLKNGITSKVVPESRYTKAFMRDKKMVPFKKFPNRLEAYQWEFGQNQISRGPLNLNMH